MEKKEHSRSHNPETNHQWPGGMRNAQESLQRGKEPCKTTGNITIHMKLRQQNNKNKAKENEWKKFCQKFLP